MKVFGNKVRQKDKGHFIILMELIIKGNGVKIYRMGKVKKYGLMVHNMKGNLIKGKYKAEGNSYFQMDLIMKENLWIIKFKEKVIMYG